MATTRRAITELYAETIERISKEPFEWKAFLVSAGKNYKLDFPEQVLVFAQRPQASAVLEIERWNSLYGRWVTKGSTGIAVFGQAGTRALKYYFDIADTYESRFSRPVNLWAMKAEYADAVASSLQASFGESAKADSLAEVLFETAKNLATDNYGDYFSDYLEYKSQDPSSAPGATKAAFERALRNSVACTLGARCGFDMDFISNEVLAKDLSFFNTAETLNVLGCATSDVAEMALREIAATIRSIEREGIVNSRRVVMPLNPEHTAALNLSKTIRSEYGDKLRDSGRTPAPELEVGREQRSVAQSVFSDETGVSQNPQEGALHEPAHLWEAEQPSGGSGRTGKGDVGRARAQDGEGPGSGRENEAHREDEVGGSYEQHQDERSRDRGAGSDPPLEPLACELEQISLIEEAGEEKAPASFYSGNDSAHVELGSPVFIGESEYEMLGQEDGIVTLFDKSSPLFPREMPLTEFTQKYRENPLNDPSLSPSPPKQATEKTRETSPAPRKRKPPAVPLGQSQALLRENFTITDDDLGTGSHYTKLHNNMNALRVLAELEEEGREPTEQDLRYLSSYVGWGSLAKVFDDDDSSWVVEKSALRSRLSESQYASARASTLNAHYTSPIIIKAMYEALSNMGFVKGNILEPACGTGNFFGLLPEKMVESKLFGVELDPTTASIARYLYPSAEIRNSGFEETSFPHDFFDVAIGNVPFGSYSVADKRYDKHSFLIHDYFFAHTLDLVRPGGIVAFITSKGTLDKKNPKVRRYLAERADLIGAIRLPNNAFKENAGTEVTADIIFLQKRECPCVIEPDWVHLGQNDEGIVLNSYFVEHPEMVLGTMTHEGAMHYGRGDETTCKPHEDEDLADLLKGAVAHIHAEVADYEREAEEDGQGVLIADPEVKNYSFTAVGERLYFRIDSKMYPQELSKTATSRVKGMVALRDVLRELIDLQTQDAPDGDIVAAQAKLNFLYDGYTKKYGILNSRGNAAAFSDDSSYALLCALEDLDSEGNFLAKADMFSKRTIRPYVPITRVDTPTEALAVSLSEKARVDLDFMSELCGQEQEKLAEELQGLIFLDPESTEEARVYLSADEYLSGNVRTKLEIARSRAKTDARFDSHVAALEQVLPQDLTASEISVRLGATWVPPEDVQDFMYELLDTPYWRRSEVRVHYSPVSAQWSVSGKSRDSSNVKALSSYGTHRANAYRIIEDTLNLRDTKVFDYPEVEEGKRRAVLNRKETAIALAKQDLIKEAFQNWIFSEPERRERLVRKYNDTFNSLRLRSFDGSHLRFPGMNPEFAFRKHQLDAVARIMYAGNTLLAHVVGAGKTFVIVAASQEMKRIGLCSKSLIVVPNHLTEQWASEYLKLYPSANILVSTKKDFEKKNRRRFCARIATGDYDAVIIGQSQFEKIPMSVERQKEMIEREIKELVEGIAEVKEQRGERFTIKQLEATKKRLEARLKKLNSQERKDDVIEFEQLGIDRLFIDESHYYKNLFFYTKMRNVGGIPQTEAQKSSDLFSKCRYLDELTGGKGIIFATGTPISNSMVELYTVQRYLQYDDLLRLNLQHFDSWASTFGETVTAVELAPEGTGYRQKTRFAKFYNLPELMTLFRQVADIQTSDMLDLPVPKVNYHNISVEPSAFQRELVQGLSERADRVRNRMVNATEDNMLLITNDGRKLALDQRLVSEELPDEPKGKVAVCADNIFELWKAHQEKKLTQLAFCDLSTPKKDGSFSVYNDLRNKLMERGVPQAEIAFIHDYESEAKKAELFAKVRTGEVRVLLGSTQKMGAGTNVQVKLIALHDLDCPWRPSDLQQRLGRIERQGNTNPEVEVYRYVTENTFDSYLYQLVENKQRFIGQIMTSKSPVRSAADVDETALSYAELKALATGNPLIKERMDLEVEVSRLKLLKSNHLSQRYSHEDNLAKVYPQKIKVATERIAEYESDVLTAKKHPPMEKDSFTMQVRGAFYTERAEAGQAILDTARSMTSPEPIALGNYRGFNLELAFERFTKSYQVLVVGSLKHTADLGSDGAGAITRIDNAIARIESGLVSAKNSLADTERQRENSQVEVAKPFAQEEALKEKSERLAKLDKELNMDENDQEIIDVEAVEPETTREKALER